MKMNHSLQDLLSVILPISVTLGSKARHQLVLDQPVIVVRHEPDRVLMEKVGRTVDSLSHQREQELDPIAAGASNPSRGRLTTEEPVGNQSLAAA
jgi:hypothetical protein